MENKFYMHEFQFFDGESIVRFNIVDLNEDKQEIYIAITRQGKITAAYYYLKMFLFKPLADIWDIVILQLPYRFMLTLSQIHRKKLLMR